MVKKLPVPLRFIILTYLQGLILFTLLRTLLLVLNFQTASYIPLNVIAKSFLTGLQFDNVISGYFLALPSVTFFLFSFFPARRLIVEKIVFYFIVFIYFTGFLILCSDIPWFEHQQTRLTVAAVQWTNTPGMMFQFVFSDVRNYPYLLLLALLCYVFYISVRRVFRKSFGGITIESNRKLNVVYYIVFLFLTFLAIRGRVTLKSPIRWGTAFTSEYNLTNQLGLNPVYTFMQSMLDKLNPHNKRLTLMDESKAIQTVRSYYKIPNGDNAISPLERKILPTGQPNRYNVVLVLMESMSSYNLSYFGNTDKRTPVLDSLFRQGLSFENFYSDGIHTFNGVYSSLFGMPSLPERHHMKDLNNQQAYGGLARWLSANNYSTVYFTSHDEQFDNAGGFLAANGFGEIVSQKDYQSKDILNALGVPDHILFNEVISHLNSLHETGKSFFAAVLTASNHGPYEIPPGIAFKPHAGDIRRQLVEYADWSIGNFILDCSKKTWFDSTIFIFTGDHGAIIGDRDANISYHHVPLIVYAPKIIKPLIHDGLGGQVDIFPTVMGMLNLPYTNNSFGIDLLNERREFITFTYDESYGAFGLKDYLIKRKDITAHYSIENGGRNQTITDNPGRADSMLNFSKSVFQTKQWMMEKKLLK